LTYSELFDRVPTKEELGSLVKGLNAFNTAVLTARLCAMFRHSAWSRHPQDKKALEKFQYWFATAILDQETKERLELRFGAENPARRPVFHPLQFLNVMRLALLQAEGDDSARPDTSTPHTHQLGTACLMVSDLLLSEEEKQNLRAGSVDDRRKQLMLQSLASLEVSDPTPLRNLFFRSYATYRIVLRDSELLKTIANECGELDIEEEFEKSFGITLMGWMSLVFCAQTVLLMNTQDDLLNKPELFIINRKSILHESTLTQEQIDSFFDALSMTFDELRTEVRKERPVDERLDLVPFKSKPFFVTAPDNYACIDFGLVTEKMHNGPYFLLSNKLPEDDRERMFKAWGFLFEAYVNWLLKGIDGRHSAKLYADTRWEGGQKSFDGVIVKSRVVAVLEYKGGFLRQDARYSNDLDTFMTDLQRKVGLGCMQLARDIGSLFPDNGPTKRLLNVPIPANPVSVLPILVVQDLMLRTPFINYFLNQRFQEERSKFKTKARIDVLPLNVVQITDLEDLVEMAEAFDLDVLSTLHQRCIKSKDMLLELRDVVRSIPDPDKNRHAPRFEEIAEKSNNEMCAILFRDFKPSDGSYA
jgi:hypothetical protein